MSVPFSNTPLRIPRGFGSLLEGLSREVLREQPQDIIGFASRYFQRLLKIREETGVDPADWAARLEDRFYNNHIFKEKVVHVVKEEPVPIETISSVYLTKDDMAKVDQSSSLEKKVVAKCVKKPVQSSASATETNAETATTPANPESAISPELVQSEDPKSQVSFPPFSLTFSPPVSLLVSPSTQEGSEKQEVEEIIAMAKEDLTNQTENRAAVRIQAVYRGYMTRKKLVKGNATEAEGDGLTEEHASGGTSEYSSEEELTFADDGDFGLTGAEEEEEEEEEEGEEEESRGGTGDEQTGGEVAGNRASTGLGVKVQLADPPAEEESYAGQSGGGLEDPNADVCGSELGPETREGDAFEEETGSREDDRNIPAAESGIEGSAEAAFGFGGAAAVDVRGAGLGAPLAGGEVGASGNAGGSALSDGDLQAPSPEGAELSRTGGQAPDEGGQRQGVDEEDGRGGESELPEPEDGVSPADETRAVETAESVAEKGETCGKAVEEDILDIPLDDEEANAAAAKIQASFRGHMTRKKLKGGEKEESERKGGGGGGGAPEEGEEPDAGGEAPTHSADTAGGAEGQSDAKGGVAVNGDQPETEGGKDSLAEEADAWFGLT